MNVAVIGATGRAGREITAELVRRGHNVTAIARHPDAALSAPLVKRVAGDVADPDGLAKFLTGHDAVVSAVHFLDCDPAKLVRAVRAAGVSRYLVVGGAASLEVAPGKKLIDQPNFPKEYDAEARAGIAFLDYLRGVDDLDWTFLSPAALLFEGPRLGTFRLGKDMLVANAEGSSISFADYAIAFVDEVENPQHVRQRFAVGY